MRAACDALETSASRPSRCVHSAVDSREGCPACRSDGGTVLISGNVVAKRGSHVMPPVYQIKFLPDGETREFYGSRRRLLRTGGWHAHRRAVGAGVVPPMQRLHGRGRSSRASKRSTVRSPTSETPPPSFFGFFQGRDGLARGGRHSLHHWELKRRRRWREGRKSPPKCLECGSTEIVLLPEGEKVENPTGPGWVEVTVTGHCSTSFNNRSYTPEGDRIPRDTKPTYWTLR